MNDILTSTPEEIAKLVDTLSEENLHAIAQQYLPQNLSGTVKHIDSDGFEEGYSEIEGTKNLTELQKLCWDKFSKNPQIRSYISDYKGGLSGKGFNVVSDIFEVNQFLKEIIEDVRNELYTNMTKYVARSEIEGELFLMFTAHTSGFTEVDFISPSALVGGDEGSGIFFHPKKQTMPVCYEISFSDENNTVYVPSIYCAYIENLAEEVNSKSYFDKEKLKFAEDSNFKELNGFRRFIVRWDKGILKKRNVSHIVCTLNWIEQYEQLKRWEILHKKSSGSYLWVIEMQDTKAFRTWLSMTPEQKQETGIYAEKTPGGTLMLPPGLTLKCHNPNLPRISDTDTDILHMVTSGLNTTDHALTGKTSGSTFAGIKETGKSATDRLQNEIEYFERFLRYDFWRHIFYIKGQLDSKFKTSYKKKEVWGFDENGEPIFRNVEKQVHDLIYFEFPTSEVQNVVDKANAFLGSKHAAVTDALGVPASSVARKLGFTSYPFLRLQKATEEAMYPELRTAEESEAVVEKASEPGKDEEATKETEEEENKKKEDKDRKGNKNKVDKAKIHY
jgi:hypothetical protein